MLSFNIEGFNQPLYPRNIYGIGRNYAKHASEMKSEVPDKPVVFLKPVSSLIDENDPILLPSQSNDVQHEVELVLIIGREGKFIPKEATPDYIAAIGVGIDVTARDLQREAKSNGLPWTLAKGFDTFGALSQLAPYTDWNSLKSETLSLQVNCETRQSAPLSDMIFDPSALISYLSTIFTLNAGDIIFTGTPEGVAPINQGDTLEAAIGNLVEAKFNVHDIPE